MFHLTPVFPCPPHLKKNSFYTWSHSPLQGCTADVHWTCSPGIWLLSCKDAFYLVGPQAFLLCVIILSQLQNFSFAFVELCFFLPIFLAHLIPLNTSHTVQCISYFPRLGIICRLTDGMFGLIFQTIKTDVNSLKDVTTNTPPTG